MPTSRTRSQPTDIAIHRACGVVGRVETIPLLLKGLVKLSQLRFAVVAHVTEDLWVACAVEDQAGFGVKTGDTLEVGNTLCKEVRETREAIVIPNVAEDPVYCDHAVPKHFQFQSYISVPIRLPDGTYYGNLCALDREPMKVDPRGLTDTVELLADLIARRISGEIEREIDRAAVLRAHDDTRRMHALDRETVTRLQQTSVADQERLEAAELQSGLRDEFIAVLGHDLRNPLAAIVTYAELLKRDQSEAMRIGIANRISLSAKRMGDIIGNVMDFTRIRIGDSLPIDLAPVPDLCEVLLHTAKEVQDAHPARQISIRVDRIPTVRGDSVRLQQLASNLLGNAITHGDPVAPVTFAALWSDEGLDLWVENGGAAIPADRQARLFEPFQQGEGVVHGQGLGLGLHISAQVARAHCGTLTVESDDRATRFTARLPLQPV